MTVAVVTIINRASRSKKVFKLNGVVFHGLPTQALLEKAYFQRGEIQPHGRAFAILNSDKYLGTRLIRLSSPHPPPPLKHLL